MADIPVKLSDVEVQSQADDRLESSTRTSSTGEGGVTKKRFIGKLLFWLNAILLALIVRLPWLPFASWDFHIYTEPWYKFIIENGYFQALKYDFSNTSISYLYLLSLVAYLFRNLPYILGIKFLSIGFDFLLAFFVYKCVRLKYSHTETVPHLAALVTLLAPTVILNGAAWGQNDSICTAFLMACLYGMLSERWVGAFIAFGLSFSFEPQALLLAPLFLWLLMKKQVNWRYFFLSPLVYLSLLVPAWAIGRPLGELLLIYPNQANSRRELAANIANLYEWIPNRYFNWWPIGVAFSFVCVAVIAVFVYNSRVKITENLVVYLATFSVLIMPFTLPLMLYRYYFAADVIAIVFAFYFPKYWFTPVIIGMTSLILYFHFLYDGWTLIPLEVLAFFPLALIVVLGWQLLRILGHLPPSPANTPLPRRTSSATPGEGTDREAPTGGVGPAAANRG